MLLKPASFAPILCCIGAFIILISKKNRTQDIASVIIGFAIIFIGMSMMESGLAPLKESEAFANALFMFKNPVLGVLVGFIAAALLQSSSASVGVLQAISTTGKVTFSMALPIILGMNIGRCVIVCIATLGTDIKCKRLALIDIVENIIGAALFMVVMYSWQAMFGFSFWNTIVNKSIIANFHSLFNIINTMILLPFTTPMIKASAKLMKANEVSKIDEELALLDSHFLATPHLAIEQAKKVIVGMGETIKENFAISSELLAEFDQKKLDRLNSNEKFLDKSETVLGDYLVKVTAQKLTARDNKATTEILHTVSDFERIGDYCVNIANVAEFNTNASLIFSNDCKRELHYIVSATQDIINMTVEAYKEESSAEAQRVEPLEETIDELNETLRARHIARLQRGECDTQRGISLVDVLTNIERISDHCSNVAAHLITRLDKDDNKTFDTHEQIEQMHKGVSEEYRALQKYYESLYCDPIR